MAELINPKKTLDVIRENDFRFQKKFGQNFLIDAGVLSHIISSSEISKDDCVLEIGPGIGTMTQALCEAAGHVIAVEIDGNLIPILEKTLASYDNVSILHKDILKVDLKALCHTYHDDKPLKVVANLPYYITTPIIMELLEKHLPVSSITVMVQKEVADRMKAKPGSKDYGALSLAVQFYSDPEIVQLVPPNCFIPRPTVSSSVIRLRCYDTPPVSCQDEAFMFDIIHAAFNQRRKTLQNALSSGLSISKTATVSALKDLNLKEDIRGEALSLSQFAALSNSLYSEKENV
ncbi:MAG: 16S rRNA (adenine(1518)-N(6)/adenine(1519)-N(6))-dimethyltransferase RsmA [Oribacterium sp.]|nr:16S rRNA (adenine(1518)-N(6)/adenine(1519)-N(6))-dimethyltransferase RsmA [Oribacterium sp.]